MGIGDFVNSAWSDVTSTVSAAQQAVYTPVAGGLLAAKNFYDDHLGDPLPDRLGAPKAAPTDAKHVILVGGYMGDANYMKVMKRSLEHDGYIVDVYAPDNGVGSVKDAAKGLAQLVNKVKGESPGGEVNLVTYSAGVSIARTYLSLCDANGNLDDHDRHHIAVNNSHKPVHKLVVLDGSWRGDSDSTWQNVLGGPAWRDVQKDGPIMSALNSMPGDGLPDGTQVATVYPNSDSGGGDVQGAVSNQKIDTKSSHADLPRRSNEAYEAVRDQLD